MSLTSEGNIDQGIVSNSRLDNPNFTGITSFPSSTVAYFGFEGTSMNNQNARLLNPVVVPVAPVWGTTTVTIDIKNSFEDHSVSQVFVVGSVVYVRQITNTVGSYTSDATLFQISAVVDMGDYWSFTAVCIAEDSNITYDPDLSIVYERTRANSGVSNNSTNFSHEIRHWTTPVVGVGVESYTLLYAGQAPYSNEYGTVYGSDNYLTGIGSYKSNNPFILSSEQRGTGIFTTNASNLEVLTIKGYNELVFNDTGSSSLDFRMEGDTDTYLLFLDSSADSIGIGTSFAHSNKLEVYKTGSTNSSASLKARFDSTATSNFNFQHAGYFEVNDTTSTTHDTRLHGVSIDVYGDITANNTGSQALISGFNSSSSASGTLDYMIGISTYNWIDQGRTVTGVEGAFFGGATYGTAHVGTMWGCEVGFEVEDTSSVDLMHMFYAQVPSGSAIITALNAFYVEDLASRATTTHGINFAGSGVTNDIFWGGDTNLYRNAANELKTDDTFDAASYKVGGVAGISVTITTAALTGGGTQGSMTFTNGILTAQVAAT